ncbi:MULTISPECIES: hypothetical protein [unclassified Fibrobacter]|uniref:hypothetical protein n=1 Tax=unclassified Fibrobacter TaxID=2634177 RepID=UPI000D790253|nr:MULTISPECIES: hypothetical protein [unclassified Fibrobacter]PWJ62544.1 hypothetical protein BGX12_12149 [Fibrobacter sp. UWR4]PZW67329.1 hypothetical protein C8E88_10262 [Fibrobacter sp. UWR1]
MNKMKLSAIALGLAAAGAFAQAPAAAPAAAPAQEAAPAVAQADSVKAAEEAKADEAKKAEEEKAAAEAKKAEEEKAAAEAKKAEEEKAAAEAKKAEEEKAAAEAKKAEEEKAAAEAQKAEEAAPAENTDVSEVANAAGNAMDALKASMNEGTSKANMEVKMSGEVELDAYTNDIFADGDLKHEYATTVDLNFDVKFNEKWTAFVGLEADAAAENAGVGYNGAWIKYQPADFFYVQVGDLTFMEGAFKAYYDYDDPTYTAAGMKEHDIRGMQIGLAGLELGFGFARNANDFRVAADDDANYNLHLAYEFNYAGQHLRPYVDYKSYQEAEHNELHAGIDAGLTLGGFSFRAVYGFHADYLADGGNVDMTSAAHTILAEPSFEVSIFQIKTSFFYAFLSNDDLGRNEVANDVPEYMFAYAEPAFKFAEFIKIGIPVEFHTNTLDDDADISTLDLGARVYIEPVENLSIMATGMFDIPVGDNNDDDDVAFRMGAEMVFSF